MKASSDGEHAHTVTVYTTSVGLPSFMTLEQTSRSEEPWGPVISHRTLSHCEILYLTGGEGRIAVDDRWFDAAANQVFFIPPKVPLDIVTQEENRLDLIYAHFHFQKDDDYTRLTGLAPYILHEIHSFDERAYPNMLILPDQTLLPPDNSVLKYLRAALETYEARNFGFYQETSLLLLGVLHQLSRILLAGMSQPTAGARGATTGLAKRIRTYLLHHADTFSGMKEIGDAFNMNSTHLSRVFKSRYGESVVSFVNRIRVELAKKYLVTTDRTVPEVAKTSGFKTTSHFRRVFKNSVGFSAIEFRAHRALQPTPAIAFSTPFDSPPEGKRLRKEHRARRKKE